MREAATSDSVAITETSHYRAGIILHYYVYAQSRMANLVTSFPLQNKTNKGKMLRTMVLSFVYSPSVGLSRHMSTFGKIVKLIFCQYIVLVPNRCLADTTRSPEVSVFFMVSDGCLTTRVRG